jgi:cytochrome P450
VLAFVEHPAELARVVAEPALLPSAIEEVVRFRSPAQLAFRETRRDVELGGKTIPAGKLVLVVVGAANRDPSVFPDPDRFDVGRDPNPHLGFGQGIHYCLGAPLARLEARVALGDLLERFARIELASTRPWTPRKALLVHGPAALPLRVARR